MYLEKEVVISCLDGEEKEKRGSVAVTFIKITTSFL